MTMIKTLKDAENFMNLYNEFGIHSYNIAIPNHIWFRNNGDKSYTIDDRKHGIARATKGYVIKYVYENRKYINDYFDKDIYFYSAVDGEIKPNLNA